jgi:hypothetical protein
MKTKFFLVLVVFLFSFNIYSRDTLETFDIGFTDFEYYHSTSNLSKDKKVYSNEVHFGIGITSMFSAHYGVITEKSNDVVDLVNSFGFLLTPLNTEHFDIDVYLDLDSGYTTLIGFEFNYDLKDDLALAGLYFRPEIILNNGYNGYNLVFGSYYTFLEDMQLLLEFDVNQPSEEDFNIGGITIGFNYSFLEKLELITEFNIDIPQNNEEVNYSLMLGFLATLP